MDNAGISIEIGGDAVGYCRVAAGVEAERVVVEVVVTSGVIHEVGVVVHVVIAAVFAQALRVALDVGVADDDSSAVLVVNLGFRGIAFDVGVGVAQKMQLVMVTVPLSWVSPPP